MRNRTSILAIEDSAPDRLRLRSILERTPHDFRFAWDAENRSVPSIDKVAQFVDEGRFQAIILDLAWIKQDDARLDEMIFCDKTEIDKNRNEYHAKPKNGLPWISGFDFLDRLNQMEASPPVLVVTQYIPPVSMSMRSFLTTNYKCIGDDIFHKWRDAEKLRWRLLELCPGFKNESPPVSDTNLHPYHPGNSGSVK